MARSLVSTEDFRDHEDLVDEVSDILASHGSRIRHLTALLKDGRVESSHASSVEYQMQQCQSLSSELQRAREWIGVRPSDLAGISEKFVQSGFMIGALLKTCAAIYYSTSRHTPTLRGFPSSVHPEQNHLSNPSLYADITVDYLRAGCQFEVPRSLSEVVWRRHPLLDAFADAAYEIIYGTAPHRDTAFAFNSALGAIKTARNIVESIALREGRKIILHKKTWLEIAADIELSNSSAYEIVDTLDPIALARMAAEPGVVGLLVEPIYNHPEMARLDVERLLGSLTSCVSPTYIIVDAAHTPEIKALTSLSSNIENVCVMEVVSAVKFFQAGWDLAKGGALFLRHPRAWTGRDPICDVLRFREGASTVPALEEAYLLQVDTRYSFRSRLKRLDRNISSATDILSSASRTESRYSISCAPGAKFAYIHLAGSGVAAGSVFNEIISAARTRRIPLVDSSTFGLSIPHVHLVIHPHFIPTIRYSPGSINSACAIDATELISNVLNSTA